MLARCAHCQKTFSTDRFGVQSCPHCGSAVHLADPAAPPPAPSPPALPPASAGPSPGAGAPPPGPWAAPPGAPGEASAPFARRRELGFVNAFVQTWKLVALQPAAFFRALRLGESGSAVLFGVVALSVSQAFQAVYGYLMGAAMQGTIQGMLKGLPEGSPFGSEIVQTWALGRTPGGMVGQILAAPFLAVAALYLSAAVIHLCLLLFRAGPRGFDCTLTVVGYAAGLQLVAAVPVPGLAPTVATVWFLVAAIVGLGEAQRCGTGRAAAATLLPGLLLCLCCCGGAVAFFGTLQSLFQGVRGTTI
jgi:hypothetical protein